MASNCLYTLVSCCSIGKCVAGVPLERHEKMCKIFSTLFIVLGILSLIAAASAGRLWLHIFSGVLYIIVGSFGIFSAMNSQNPMIPLIFSIGACMSTVLVAVGCIIWFALIDTIVSDDCELYDLSSGACHTSRVLNIAFTSILLIIDLAFFMPYSLSGFCLWRAAVAVKRYKDNSSTRAPLSPREEQPN